MQRTVPLGDASRAVDVAVAWHPTVSFAFLLAGVVLLGAFAVVALSRYLQYRETIKLLELGGDAATTLRLRERWRNRAGLLHGVKLLVIGGILLLFTSVVPRLRLWPAELGAIPSVSWGLVGLVLFAVGAVYLAAYGVWAREQNAFSETGRDSHRSHDLVALDRRRGLIRGVALVLVGAAVLALAPAFSFLSRSVRGQVFEVEYVIGVIGVFLIALGLAVAVAYWAMSRTPGPPDGEAKANAGEAKPEGGEP